MSPDLLQLSDEVVLLIFEQVSHISQRSLSDLCLVSKRCCTISSSLLYRTLSITPHNLAQLQLTSLATEAYTFRANMLAHSRHLAVSEELDWVILASLISGMKRLETMRWLYWDDPFPRIIQKCLSKSWPNAKLFIEGLSIGFQTDVDEVQLLELDLLKSLVDFQNIHSVKVVIEYENPVAMRWLKDVLLGSPKLEIFHLTLPRDRDGKVEWTADGLGSYDLCVESGECLAPLKELLYEIRRPPYTEDRPLIPPSFFNLTQIRCLELKGFDIEKFLVQLKDQPLHLDALTITSFTDPFFSGFNATLEELIPQLRGVGTLRIITTMELLPTYHFFHLSDTITDFEFRSARDCIDSFPYMVTRSFFLPNQLDELRTACPLISSLVLDMKIGDNLPYDFLDSLAHFPQLSSLRLYFHFESQALLRKQDAKPVHISTDCLTVRHLFSYLRDRKTGVSLDELEVMMSDRPSGSRRVDFWQLEEHDRPSMLFTCREDSDGNPIVKHDPYDDEDVSWWSYFDPNKPKTFRGQTYPNNLLDIIEAGKNGNKS